MLNLSIDPSNIEQSFDQIANQLLNEYLLSVGNVHYQLTELEFYYHNKEARIEDNFAHTHGDQYKDGAWRLHGAGLDIILKKIGVYYGGILIRGIQELDSELEPIKDRVIDGPWNTATICIRQMGAVENPNPLFLRKRTKKQGRTFIKSPRVGLFLKNTKDLEYICKPWRYLSVPIVTKKNRHLIFLQLQINDRKTAEERLPIMASLKQSQRARNNYLAYFEKGKELKETAFVGGKLTVEYTCKLFGHYCRKYSKL